MNLKDAYDYGYDNGYGIAQENYSDEEMKDTDKFISDCMCTESEIFRQFTPFEFYAKEFNESDDPESMWEEYEKGVEMGIKTVIKAHSLNVEGSRFNL